MVRIPLVVEKHIRLPACLLIQGTHKPFTLINFAVDTGSTCTLISLADSDRLQVPKSLLTQAVQIGFGGMTHYRHTLKGKVTLALRVEDGTFVKVPFEECTIVYPVSHTEKIRDTALSLPSIIGLDFLKAKKFRFVYEAAEGMAWLESTEELESLTEKKN